MGKKKVTVKVKNNLKNLVLLIEALDGFRRGRGVSLSMMEKAYYNITIDLPIKWRYIKRIIQSLIRYPMKDGRVFRHYKLLRWTRTLTNTGIVIIIIGTVIALIFGRSELTLASLFIGIGLVYSMFFLNWYSLKQIYKYYDEHADELSSRTKKLKDVAQILINIMREELVKNGISPTKYPLRLYNIDYKGIEVISKPTFYRKTYLCIVSTEEES